MSFNQTRCRSCHAQIVWAITAKNTRKMPVDAQFDREHGNVALEHTLGAAVAPVATVLSGEALDNARRRHQLLYTSHFATCPDAERFRKER